MRILLKTIVGLVGAYLLLSAALLAVMVRPPAQFAQVMARVPGPLFMLLPFEPLWSMARAGQVHTGEPAPDFNLETLDKSGRVRLSQFRGQKPVVLIFGSYTWPPFRREVPALNKIYEQYKDRAAFYIVYILEAHASDVWQMPSNIKQNVIVATPHNGEERSAVADSCMRKLHIEIPALIDDFGNTTELAYTGWPDRLFVVDRDGRLAYKSAPGPFGFHPQEMETALRKML